MSSGKRQRGIARAVVDKSEMLKLQPEAKGSLEPTSKLQAEFRVGWREISVSLFPGEYHFAQNRRKSTRKGKITKALGGAHTSRLACTKALARMKAHGASVT